MDELRERLAEWFYDNDPRRVVSTPFAEYAFTSGYYADADAIIAEILTTHEIVEKGRAERLRAFADSDAQFRRHPSKDGSLEQAYKYMGLLPVDLEPFR